MLKGTKFQIMVWNELKKIPEGEVRTYKEIALAIGKPKSARAVANACGKNPLLIIVPCHRVISIQGKLTGFSALGGIETKEKLLKLESIKI